jgi:DNA-binding beta-propeller fold protein YncE
MVFRVLLAVLPLLPQSVVALGLVETGRYELNRPASLDYDPTFCGLWIANEGPEAVLVTLQGDELRRITSDLFRIKAIAIEGDHLIVGDGLGQLQRLTKDGVPLAAPFRLTGGAADTEGIAIAADGTLVTVEDDPERLSWFAPDGELQRRIDTMTLSPPISEAQGIAIDPRTGHMLIVDDWEGSNSLYEFSQDGRLLAQENLLEYGTDPEGIAIRPGSNQLFIAFDGGARIVTFDYTPTLPEGADPLPPGADCMMF